MFSKTCQYAVQGTMFIAYNSEQNEPIQLKRIAEAQRLPSYFLSKILQSLAKKRILKSQKGPNGGFSLGKPSKEIFIIDIFEAIDGMSFFEECLIGFDKCSPDRPCPMHVHYEGIKAEILEKLSALTIHDLCRDVEEGKSFLSFLNFPA